MTHGCILVVDDDMVIRETLAEVLELEGYPVATAAHGAQALAAVEQNPPALVLLDLRMPVLDGWGFAAELQRRGVTLPLVVVSAESPARAAVIGAVAWIEKPFEMADLVETVAAVVPLPASS